MLWYIIDTGNVIANPIDGKLEKKEKNEDISQIPKTILKNQKTLEEILKEKEQILKEKEQILQKM